MANRRGNPDIAQFGVSTRFGEPQGPDPSIIAKEKNPQSIRAALRRLAAAEFDFAKPLTAGVLAGILSRDGKTLTGAQAVAIQKFSQALSNWRAMDSLIDSVDGKLVEKRSRREGDVRRPCNRGL